MTNTTSPTTQAGHTAPAQPSVAMVLATDAQFKLALEPTTFGETMQACELVASIGLCGCTTPAAVLVRVMMGRSLGMTFVQSIVNIYDIDGKPALDANAMVALCLQSSMCEYFRCTYTDREKSTYKAKRRSDPEPAELTFTIQEAEAAGLMDRGATAEKKAKSNWNRWTADMLRARASSKLARMVFPDVVRGLHSREELYDGMADPDEMVGEVVTPQVSNAPKRDFAAESRALIAKIETITPEMTTVARKPIREEVLAWDAPEPYKSAVVGAYNDCPKVARKQEGPIGAPQAPPASPPAAPPPVETKRPREPGED